VVHDDASNYLDKYTAEIEQALEEELLLPLCKDIETDLRLHVHSQTEGSVNHFNPWVKVNITIVLSKKSVVQ
jgi:hypothetical protein